MRVDRGVAEPRRDQLLELLGEHVLEHLCLCVHPIPGHPELLREEQLEQPMVADHLERHLSALLGQPHAAVGLVLDETHLGELAQHRRDRPRRDAEPLRESVRRDGSTITLFEGVDRLRVVLNRRRN